MGRYLERASYVCRLLKTQVSVLIDRPIVEIQAGWTLIYESLRCQPPGGILEDASEAFTLADAFTLAGDLTFERSSMNSTRNCLEFGRENARQIRHCISDELWLHLNSIYLEFKETELTQIWKSAPENFYASTEQQLNQVFSLADLTMYRDAPWRFIRLGKEIEAVQRGAALLGTSLKTAEQHPDLMETQLQRDLSAFSADEIYRRIKGHIVEEETAVDMLISDRKLPGSLINNIRSIDRHLLAIGPGHSDRCGLIRMCFGRLADLSGRDWRRSGTMRVVLGKIETESRLLNDLIEDCYFRDYGP